MIDLNKLITNGNYIPKFSNGDFVKVKNKSLCYKVLSSKNGIVTCERIGKEYRKAFLEQTLEYYMQFNKGDIIKNYFIVSKLFKNNTWFYLCENHEDDTPNLIVLTREQLIKRYEI